MCRGIVDMADATQPITLTLPATKMAHKWRMAHLSMNGNKPKRQMIKEIPNPGVFCPTGQKYALGIIHTLSKKGALKIAGHTPVSPTITRYQKQVHTSQILCLS